MQKEIFFKHTTLSYSEDRNDESRIVPDGEYQILVKGFSRNEASLVPVSLIDDSSSSILGFIDDENYDFTEIVGILTQLGLTRVLDFMKEKNYWFAEGGYGFGYITLQPDEVQTLKDNGYGSLISFNDKLDLYEVAEPMKHLTDDEYTCKIKNGSIYINNCKVEFNWFSDDQHIYVLDAYPESGIADELYDYFEDIIDRICDVIFDSGPKNLDEFFDESDEGDYVVRMKLYLEDTVFFSIYKTLDESGEVCVYKLVVNLDKNDHQFFLSEPIKSVEDLRSKFQTVADALRHHPEFKEYVEMFEDCADA